MTIENTTTVTSENSGENSSENFNLAWHVYKYSIETPHAVAVASEDNTITYAELARRASQLAECLKQSRNWLGHSTPPRVGILSSRTIDAYVAVVGACWAGATYVPLGTKLPEERLLTIFSLCNFSAIIADKEGAKLLSDKVIEKCPPFIIAPGANNIPQTTPTNIDLVDFDSLPPHKMIEPAWMDKDDIAYIIFTSGTTGVPKGVMISSGSIHNLVTNIAKVLGLTAQDRFISLCELTFDPSVCNMFATWMVGAAHYILPANRVMNAVKFARTAKITAWSSSPSLIGMFRQGHLLNTTLPDLRVTTFGGEPLTEGVVTAWNTVAPHNVIYNVYGPTEATVCSHFQQVAFPAPLAPGHKTVAIGNPLPGCEAAIMDGNDELVPDGVRGELMLAGVQLAQGYLNDQQLTARRFPIIRGKRWYRTGDFAIRDTSDVFHCLGRIDNQVKVLGNRIELEDVDSHLRNVTKLDVVGTIAWPFVDGAAQGLVSFVGAISIESKQVIAELKKRLPAYMVPSKVHAIENMPFNQGEKIDLKALRQLLEDGLI